MADITPCTCIRNAMDVDCPIHGEAAVLVPAPQPEVERIKCNLQTVTASAKTWADLPEILDWYQRDVASLLAAVSPLVPAPPAPQKESRTPDIENELRWWAEHVRGAHAPLSPWYAGLVQLLVVAANEIRKLRAASTVSSEKP